MLLFVFSNIIFYTYIYTVLAPYSTYLIFTTQYMNSKSYLVLSFDENNFLKLSTKNKLIVFVFIKNYFHLKN